MQKERDPGGHPPRPGLWGPGVSGSALSSHSGRKCHLNQACSQALLACELVTFAPSHLPHGFLWRTSVVCWRLSVCFCPLYLSRQQALVLFLTVCRCILHVTVPWTRGRGGTPGSELSEFGYHHLGQIPGYFVPRSHGSHSMSLLPRGGSRDRERVLFLVSLPQRREVRPNCRDTQHTGA